MQMVAWVSLSLLTMTVIIGAVVVIRRRMDSSKQAPGALLALACGSLIVSLVLVVLLAVAQSQVCSVLGGTWIGANHSCRHERGGNGGNDPATLSWGRIVGDPAQSDGRYRPVPLPSR